MTKFTVTNILLLLTSYKTYFLNRLLNIGKSVYRSQVKQEHYIPREAITCFALRLLGVTKHTSK